MSVVLVSGATSGVGRLVALAFARAGHQVAAGARSPEGAAALERAAAAESLPLHVVSLDVTSPHCFEMAVRNATERLGPVDILVNNAGVVTSGVVEWITEEHARRVMETNFFGPLRLIQAVLPSMRERRGGSIVLIGSLHGRVPAPGAGLYAASKQASAALHDALACEGERFGIRVSTVELGPYRTGMGGRAIVDPPLSEAYAELLTALRDRTARRLTESGDPAEAAAAIVSLAVRPDPPLRLPVGKHATEWLSGDHLGEDFRRQLRGELGWGAPE
jgi:NAD(P)-dependent dehydrogenase (short-subunit alcohol dehydrogenase family)